MTGTELRGRLQEVGLERVAEVPAPQRSFTTTGVVDTAMCRMVDTAMIAIPAGALADAHSDEAAGMILGKLVNFDFEAEWLSYEVEPVPVRLDFLPSEMVAIQRALEPEEKAAAAAREAAGRKRGAEPPRTGKFPEREKGRARDKMAAYLGVSGRTLEKAAVVAAAAEADPEAFGPLVEEMDRTRRVNGVFKKLETQRSAEQLRREPSPPPDGPFRVLVVDPPWDYGRRSDPSHRSANPYPSMSLEAIKAEPFGQRATDDAILWLWTTNGFLRHAFEVLDAWGFAYRTTLTWVKDKIGTGDWLRGQTEHCLLATKGKPVVTLTNQTTALHGAARDHSRKPDEFYALVEALCPCPENGRVDWFSRGARPGWVSYGNET